jgi:hypothetical protein
MSLPILQPQEFNQEIIYIPSITVTANGDTSDNPLFIYKGNVVVFFLNVSAVGGTTPSFTFSIGVVIVK